MKGFCPLASGSKGNSIYFGTENTKILIDAGISASEISKRLKAIGVDLKEIDAVLITHEHGDHVKGLETLSSKYRIPILCNSETASCIQTECRKKLSFKIFTTGEPFTFGDIHITSFSIHHDAVDPVAFVLEALGNRCGFCTDLGFVSSLAIKHLVDCDYLYLEANHQVEMVHACNRPDVYKQRVLSRQGHLSNHACAELLDKVFHEGLKHVHLAHLSSECNSPELALKIIKEKLYSQNKNVMISIAFQEEISQAIFFGKERQLLQNDDDLEESFEALLN